MKIDVGSFGQTTARLQPQQFQYGNPGATVAEASADAAKIGQQSAQVNAQLGTNIQTFGQQLEQQQQEIAHAKMGVALQRRQVQLDAAHDEIQAGAADGTISSSQIGELWKKATASLPTEEIHGLSASDRIGYQKGMATQDYAYKNKVDGLAYRTGTMELKNSYTEMLTNLEQHYSDPNADITQLSKAYETIAQQPGFKRAYGASAAKTLQSSAQRTMGARVTNGVEFIRDNNGALDAYQSRINDSNSPEFGYLSAEQRANLNKHIDTLRNANTAKAQAAQASAERKQLVAQNKQIIADNRAQAQNEQNEKLAAKGYTLSPETAAYQEQHVFAGTAYAGSTAGLTVNVQAGQQVMRVGPDAALEAVAKGRDVIKNKGIPLDSAGRPDLSIVARLDATESAALAQKKELTTDPQGYAHRAQNDPNPDGSFPAQRPLDLPGLVNGVLPDDQQNDQRGIMWERRQNQNFSLKLAPEARDQYFTPQERVRLTDTLLNMRPEDQPKAIHNLTVNLGDTAVYLAKDIARTNPELATRILVARDNDTDTLKTLTVGATVIKEKNAPEIKRSDIYNDVVTKRPGLTTKDYAGLTDIVVQYRAGEIAQKGNANDQTGVGDILDKVTGVQVQTNTNWFSSKNGNFYLVAPRGMDPKTYTQSLESRVTKLPNGSNIWYGIQSGQLQLKPQPDNTIMIADPDGSPAIIDGVIHTIPGDE